jgi:LysM repeat protein
VEPTLRVTPPAIPDATGNEPSATPGQPTAAPTPTAASFRTTYKVKAGDTLFDIALKFHTTVKAISDLNQLTTTTLHIGQILKIP